MAQHSFTLTGNIGADPTYHGVNERNGVTKFRLCANRRRPGDREGTWIDYDTLWIEVQCWGRLAEHARRCLRKGMSVVVVGTAILETWTDADTDSNRSRIVLRASHIGPDLNRYLTTSTTPGGEIVAEPLTGGWVTSGCIPAHRAETAGDSGAAGGGGVPGRKPEDDSHPRSGGQLVGAGSGVDAEVDPPF
ncbi:single-stranded DNA-binding protein [Corynebacterium antarcticum]|uniref:single-stranded DNA-binding protein n=1 Tax=Corynebacterium antarcticum TaxID=2800405 RepID=UPI00226093C2|nr:single-stranded DNA-binding protein [Corynebacterium antarcticum]MCX7539177.1 single-stranded DNA-binding protein [Corynebacterium antarcticum]